MKDRDRSCSIAGVPQCIIDGFDIIPDSPRDKSERFYILTSFDRKKYKGLDINWRNGRILCSMVTAALLVNILNIPVS